MYCKKCGNELADNARFCGVCGTPVTQQLETNVFPNKPKKSKLKYIIIGIIVICLGVIGTIAGFKVKNYLDVKNELKKYDVVGAVIPVKDSVCVMSEKEIYEEIKARGFDVEAEDIVYFYDIDGNNYGEEYDDEGNPSGYVEKTVDPSSDVKHPCYSFFFYNETGKKFSIDIKAGNWQAYSYTHWAGFSDSVAYSHFFSVITDKVTEELMSLPMAVIQERETLLSYHYNNTDENPNSFVVYSIDARTIKKVDKLTASVLDNITYDDLYGNLMDEYGLLTYDDIVNKYGYYIDIELDPKLYE